MRVLGADLAADRPWGRPGERAVVSLDAAGRLEAVRRPPTMSEAAAQVVELAAGEPFLLGVNVPVVVPSRAARARPIDTLVLRRLGHRLSPGGRGSGTAQVSVPGEAFLAALASAGAPCLPWPDRDRQKSGVAEMHEALILKSLLWERSAGARAADSDAREAWFRATAAPGYPTGGRRAAASWAERAAALDLVMRGLGDDPGLDLAPARDALAAVASEADLVAAAALLHALLLAGTAYRYLEAPETCLFLGDREGGYVILPADGFVRRIGLREGRRPERSPLFPHGSLRAHLEKVATVASPDLLDVPGHAPRFEAVFSPVAPLYEFDNLDEMLWWKHCRHLSGPVLPLDGLEEMAVVLDAGEGAPERGTLRLVRSRHRTLSFRFEPPKAWRQRVPPRDGRVYPLRILRATFRA